MENRLTAARLREVVSYDPETGDFTLLVKRAGRSQHVGSKVGSPNSAGYLRIMVDGRSYLSHRLAWLYMTGKWPTDEIDHANGDPADNRFNNLREATRSQNNANRRSSQNASGVKGVSRRRNRWVATISTNGKQTFVGSFGNKWEAGSAYAGAAAQLHGEFARIA